MDSPTCRLLCIDLQVDPVLGIEPDAAALIGARQLLTLGRRLGWQIVHARRRSRAIVRARDDRQFTGLNPLMSEKVFFHDGRSIADCPSLAFHLETWRNETVYVAAFDHVPLLSCLLACYEPGPRLVLVDDVAGEANSESFRETATRLAAGATTISGIIAETSRRLGISVSPLPGAVGQIPRDMQV